MSWEVMRSDTEACACGKGTVTHIMEMDDWNRTRSSIEIHCPECRAKAELAAAAKAEREAKNEDLYNAALQLAKQRYLDRWLALYSTLPKKKAWQRYTGGNGYPALGTFYQHVRHAGSVTEYMRQCFEGDFEDALRKMAVEDKDIDKLLSQRSKEPSARVRHPYA